MKKMPSLAQMSDGELLSLNHEIVDLLMTRQRQERQKDLRLAFNAGEHVSFHGPEGRPIRGVIKRVNQKTLTISTDHGLWKIDPSFVLKDKASKASSGRIL